MQHAIEELIKLGTLPDSDTIEDKHLEQAENLLDEIECPVSDDEARALAGLFGPDDCYGLAWTILHLIETAPGWPLDDVLQYPDNEWIELLGTRTVQE